MMNLQDQAALTAILEQDNVDFSKARQHLLEAYNTALGMPVGNQATTSLDEWKAVRDWLTKTDEGLCGIVKLPILIPKYHLSISQKVNTISQRTCHICGANFPISTHFFDTGKLESYQSASSKTKKQFKKNIATTLAEKAKVNQIQRFGSEPLCIALTFAVKRAAKVRDVDNVVKLVLDSLKGHLFDDDRQIQHLDTIQIVTNIKKEWLGVRISKSSMNDSDDILWRGESHTFM